MDLLLPHTGTIIWMTIVFLIVFWILKKFAWKPILNALKMREESIDSALKAAVAAKEEMSKLQADNEKIVAEAKQERDFILKEARELKESILVEAKKQASVEGEKMIDAAKNAIKNEKATALNDIKEQIAKLSVRIAEKLLQEKLNNESEQKELIDKLLKEIKLN